MRHQLGFAGKSAEFEANHFESPFGWSTTSPKTSQHAGNHCAVRLNLDAVLTVAQQVAAAEEMLEKPEEDFNYPNVVV